MTIVTTLKRLRLEGYHRSRSLGPCSSPPGMFDISDTYEFIETTTRSGSPNPYWAKQCAEGVNASTNFSLSTNFLREFNPGFAMKTYQSSCTPGFPATGRGTFIVDLVGPYAYVGITKPLPWTGHVGGAAATCASNKAISKLYRKINEAHHQFQGGVFFGELHKTLDMIGKLGGRLRGGLLSYARDALALRRKSSRRFLKKTHRDLSNLWLEGVFGWQPLIEDIKDAHQALHRLLHEPEVLRFRAKGECEEQVWNNAGTDGLFVRANWKSVGIRKSTVIYYGAFRVPVRSDAERLVQRGLSLSGFDLRSFVPTVWELLPWSFFADYFVNIGEVLMALTADTSMVAWITRVNKDESYEQFSCRVDPASTHVSVGDSPPSDAQFLSASGTTCSYDNGYRTVVRTPTVVPYLLPRLKFEQFGFKKFLNTGALFSQRMSR